MLDIKFIHENAELVKAAARKKHLNFDVAELLKVDDERRELMNKVEMLRAEQKRLHGPSPEALTLKEKVAAGEEKLKTVLPVWQKLMLEVPNLPDISVPEGASDSENVEVRSWGDPTSPKLHGAKGHVELMKALGWADFEQGAKVAGFRGYFLKNEGAELSLAIWQYAKDFWRARGFQFMMGPALVRRASLLGTGFLPQGEEDLYKTQDGDYLAGTGEVATMGYYSDTVLDVAKLPIKVLMFSPCFRREAGAYGKDVSGLIRVHEFFKLEQVVLGEAKHELSVQYHEELNKNTEEFIQSLNIPYRVVVNCGGDLGLGQVKKYDIEIWVPGEQKYREISSASYFHDFQTRRLNIRYRDEAGKLHFAHSLNCTAAPTPRLLVSLVENYQQADGTVLIPEALRRFMPHAA